MARVYQLLDRLRSGPWVAGLTGQPSTAYLAGLIGAGVRSVAYVPIGEPGDPIGLLIVGAADPDVAYLERLLPDLVEYAAISAAHLGQAIANRRAISDARTAIERDIRQRRFKPVFQPIFDIDRNEAIGYEALTRFTDGRPPDVVFAEAEAVGLGIELEHTTLDGDIQELVYRPTLHVSRP